MTEYALADRWFVCEQAGHAIFLDLERERYVALAPADAARFREVLESRAADAETADFARALENEGLLVRAATRPIARRPETLDRATSTCWNGDEFPDRLSKADLRNFIVAWTRASFLTRLLPLRTIARRVQKRKTEGRGNVEVADSYEVRARSRAFFLLHPMFTDFSSSGLLRSLALVEFLACYEIYPTWVFGVRIQPFQATSWVQHGEMLLSDELAAAGGFTPIMTL